MMMKGKVKYLGLLVVALSILIKTSASTISGNIGLAGIAERYRIYVLSDPILEIQGAPVEKDDGTVVRQAPYDAELIKGFYAGDGHSVVLLDSVALADPERFNASLCDILLIPNGPTFYAGAESNLKQFFADGGRIMALGGHTFTETVDLSGFGSSSVKGNALMVTNTNPAGSLRYIRKLTPADIGGVGTYSITAAAKVDDYDGGGLGHVSVATFDRSFGSLSHQDFIVARNDTDWFTQTQKFMVTDETAYIWIVGGFFQASGTIWFDDVVIADAAGNNVFYADFDDGSAGGWEEDKIPPGTGVFAVGEGKPQVSAVEGTLGSNRPAEVGDVVLYDATNIPVFDAEHFYTGVTKVKSEPNQSVFEGEFDISGKPLEGYSAITVVGSNRGRWQPLLSGYDSHGNKKGTIGALMRVYSPNYEVLAERPVWTGYQSTAIAFFGVTSEDLFASENQALRDGFMKLPYILMHDVYVGYISNQYDSYKEGEKPAFTAYVENSGRCDASGKVRFEIVAEDDGEVVYISEREYTAKAGSRDLISETWDAASFEDDFYFIRAYTYDEVGNLIDVYETGFSIWDMRVIANGPKYTHEGNYFRLPEGDGMRAIFATGVDDTAELLLEWNQTPALWRQEFMDRRDLGVTVYQNLQQYHWYSVFADRFGDPVQREKHLRQVDNIVYLSMKYNQLYMMGLAVGENCAVTGDRIAGLLSLLQTMAERYRDVPGVMYYLNGDLRVELSASMDSDFRAFLVDKYKIDENLRIAWDDAEASLASISLDTEYAAQQHPWTEVKSGDVNEFQASLVTRWISELAVPLLAIDESKAIACEFYAFPHQLVDVPSSIGPLSFSNIGYFDPYRVFAKTLATSDQRFQGKSMGIGEFGKRTHPILSTAEHELHRNTTPEEARNYFFHVIGTTMAMGGDHAYLWSYSETTRHVFPWGVNFSNDAVHRDLYYWMRNFNLFIKGLRPKYESPDTAVITPDGTRLSFNSESPYTVGHVYAQEAFEILQYTQVGSALALNECNLNIPESVKAIFYPVSYNPPDEIYDALRDWVRNGGVLYLSGDISYDGNRKQTKTDRLEELCGVALERKIYDGIEHMSVAFSSYGEDGLFIGKPNNRISLLTARSLFSDDAGNPVVTLNEYGAGKVVYSADPIEIFNNSERISANVGLYKQVLELAGVKCIDVVATESQIKVFRQPLENGSYVTEIANLGRQQDSRVTIGGVEGYRLVVPAGHSDMIVHDDAGNVTGLFQMGEFYVGEKLLVENNAYAHISAQDGLDLSLSKSIIASPLETGSIRISTVSEWKKPTVVFGQVRDGVFAAYGLAACQIKDGVLSFYVADDMVNTIILISEEDDSERLRQYIAYEPVAAIAAEDVVESLAGDGWKLPWFPILVGTGIAAAAAIAVYIIVRRKKSMLP